MSIRKFGKLAVVKTLVYYQIFYIIYSVHKNS